MPPPPPPMNVPPGYQPYQAYQQPSVPPFASWGTRVGGHIVNGLVGLLFGLPAIISFFVVPTEIQACTVNDEPGLCELPTTAGWAIIALLGVVGMVAYLVMYARMVSATGQAWGHKAVGVRIVDSSTGGNISSGKAVLRLIFGHWVDGAVCYLGYLWPLWDKQRQTFADKIFSTYSIRV